MPTVTPNDNIESLNLLEDLSLHVLQVIKNLEHTYDGKKARGALDTAFLAVREAHSTLLANELLLHHGGGVCLRAAHVHRSRQEDTDAEFAKAEAQESANRLVHIKEIKRRLAEYKDDTSAREQAVKEEKDIAALESKLEVLQKMERGPCIPIGEAPLPAATGCCVPTSV